MEALACGCQVFSSVNHALADYLDPGFNCHKIAGYATGYDTQRILQTVKNWPVENGQNDPQPPTVSPDFFAPYRAEQLVPRLHTILQEINTFFDYQPQHQGDIPQLTRRRIAYLTLKRMAAKVKRR